jgi:acetyl-CoA acetyltransferase
VAPNYLAQSLGIDSMNYFLDHKLGGSVGMSVIGQAAVAVSAGIADCIVVYRAMNGYSNRGGIGNAKQAPTALRALWDLKYRLPSGYVTASQQLAMAASAHMARFGTTSEDLGRLAILCRTNALDNDRAVMRTPYTLEEYLASRWVVEPFRLFDCCIETDGGAAVVIVSAARAKDLPHPPLHVRGAAWGGGINVNNGRTDLAVSPADMIAPKLYAAAGLGPTDIDFAEIYDCFTYTLLSQLEGYGFAEPGGVPDKMADGAFARATGSLPINTHGGLLSEAYLQAVNHVYEAVEQIRGDAGPRQVRHHDTALVTGDLGYSSGYSCAVVLEGA